MNLQITNQKMLTKLFTISWIVYFISYGLGQLISGLIGDYYSPRLLVGLGLIGCAVCNTLVFLSSTYCKVIFKIYAKRLLT